MGTYEKEIREILYRLGVNSTYLGFVYVMDCVRMILENEERRYSMKALYIDAARMHKTTDRCVERDIRNLVRTVWKNGNRKYLEEIAGAELKERPKNKYFIGILADYVKEPHD